ncbi:MAG: VWA domain-containing protein, partial [Cellulomonadaceae bacterium]|nr:VWA domain-containing protein [Cellulomonadaceae bacterium]
MNPQHSSGNRVRSRVFRARAAAFVSLSLVLAGLGVTAMSAPAAADASVDTLIAAAHAGDAEAIEALDDLGITLDLSDDVDVAEDAGDDETVVDNSVSDDDAAAEEDVVTDAPVAEDATADVVADAATDAGAVGASAVEASPAADAAVADEAAAVSADDEVIEIEELSLGNATITVRVGGDRVTSAPNRTGNGVIAPLDGAVFQLLRASGTGAGAGTTVGTPITYDWAFATSGEGASPSGEAVFTIPVLSQGNANTVTAEGATAGTRFWVRQVSAPAGWSMNTTLRTGGTGATPSNASAYQFLTLPIGTTNAGQGTGAGRRIVNQVSGTDFMTMTPTGAGVGNRHSGGVWQNTRNNPTLPSTCGWNVAISLDMSSSMSQADLNAQQTAARQFIQALAGTPSTVTIYTFGWASPADGNVNSARFNMMNEPTTGTTGAAWNAVPNTSPSNATNWDRGFAAASASSYDLFVFITDGNPTDFGVTAGSAGWPGQNRFRNVEEGIFSSNQIKANGARVMVFGVGMGTGDAGITTRHNLRAVANGPGSVLRTTTTNLTPEEVRSTDVFVLDSFAGIGPALRDFALAECRSSVQVIKEIVPAGNTFGDVTGSRPVPGWTFDVAAATPNAEVVTPELTTAGSDNPSASTTINFPQAGSTTVTVAERQQDGYTFVQAQCVRGEGANRRTWSAEGNIDGTGDAAVRGIPVAWDDANTVCTFYNQARQGMSLSVDGTYNVPFVWTMDKTVTSEDVQVVNPGEYATFTYRIEVTGERAEANNVRLNGSVTVPNTFGAPLDLRGLEVTVDSTPVTLTLGDDTLVAAGQSREVAFTVDLPGVPTGDVTVTATHPVVGDIVETIASGGFTEPSFSNYEATLTDWFPEFAAEFGNNVVLNARERTPGAPLWDEEARAWIFEYSARRTVTERNSEETFTNTAILAPDEDNDIRVDVPVTVWTPAAGALSIRGTAVTHRDYNWTIDKTVLDPATGEIIGVAPGDSQHDARFGLQVSATGQNTPGTWVTGQVAIANPNARQALSIDGLTVTVGGVNVTASLTTAVRVDGVLETATWGDDNFPTEVAPRLWMVVSFETLLPTTVDAVNIAAELPGSQTWVNNELQEESVITVNSTSTVSDRFALLTDGFVDGEGNKDSGEFLSYITNELGLTCGEAVYANDGWPGLLQLLNGSSVFGHVACEGDTVVGITLDAQNFLSEDGLTFEYTATLAVTDLGVGSTATFRNLAVIAPDAGDQPNPGLTPPGTGEGDDWWNDQDDEDLSDDETVTVVTPPEAEKIWNITTVDADGTPADAATIRVPDAVLRLVLANPADTAAIAALVTVVNDDPANDVEIDAEALSDWAEGLDALLSVSAVEAGPFTAWPWGTPLPGVVLADGQFWLTEAVTLPDYCVFDQVTISDAGDGDAIHVIPDADNAGAWPLDFMPVVITNNGNLGLLTVTNDITCTPPVVAPVYPEPPVGDDTPGDYGVIDGDGDLSDVELGATDAGNDREVDLDGSAVTEAARRAPVRIAGLPVTGVTVGVFLGLVVVLLGSGIAVRVAGKRRDDDTDEA